MKILRNILLALIGLILIGVVSLVATGNGFILTGIKRTYLVGNPTANIDDHRQFKTNTIAAGTVQEWPLSANYAEDRLDPEFLTHLEKNDAVAFLVAKDGELLTESYFAGYNDRSKTNSFSMAKTVVTLLLGKAIEYNFIEGLDQKISDFIPEFGEDEFGREATIGSLSSMSSGYNWDESYYSPFSPTVELYYGDDVVDFLSNGSFSHEVDEYFYYSSASTQLLSIVIKRAVEKANPGVTLSVLLSKEIWQPLGMNDEALWHLDNNGMELGYCCINTNARNFAKLGQLLFQDGWWNNQQIIDSSFIETMRTPKFVENYGYSTWLGLDAVEPYYYFRGHLGQYIIIVPNENMVIVRLGKTTGSGLVEDNIDEFIRQAKELN